MIHHRTYTPAKLFAKCWGPTLLLAVLTLNSTPAAAGKYYKWIDGDGLTHYSQHPPKDQTIKKEQIKVSDKEPTDAPKAISALESNRKSLMKAAEKRSSEKEPDPAEAERQEAIEKNCGVAKKNHAQLTEHARIREPGEDGELRYLSEEEHQKRKDDNLAYIKKYCE